MNDLVLLSIIMLVEEILELIILLLVADQVSVVELPRLVLLYRHVDFSDKVIRGTFVVESIKPLVRSVIVHQKLDLLLSLLSLDPLQLNGLPLLGSDGLPD